VSLLWAYIFLNNNLKIRHVYHRPFVLPEIEFPPPKVKRFGVFVCERVFWGQMIVVVRKGGRGRGGRGKGVNRISQFDPLPFTQEKSTR
jgi:hypothetical protein